MTHTKRHPEEDNRYSFTGYTVRSYKRRVRHLNRGVKQRNRHQIQKNPFYLPELLFKRNETDMMC